MDPVLESKKERLATEFETDTAGDSFLTRLVITLSGGDISREQAQYVLGLVAVVIFVLTLWVLFSSMSPGSSVPTNVLPVETSLMQNQ